MASFDLGKLSDLDEQLSKILVDMQVRVAREVNSYIRLVCRKSCGC